MVYKIFFHKEKQTSVKYRTWEAEEPKKSESREWPSWFSLRFECFEHTALNFSIVVLSVKEKKGQNEIHKFLVLYVGLLYFYLT